MTACYRVIGCTRGIGLRIVQQLIARGAKSGASLALIAGG